MTVGSDIIQVDGGKRQAFDMHSVGNKAPEQDSQQDLDTSFETLSNGKLQVTVKRPLDTGDFKDDYVLPVDQPFDIAWAVNTKSSDISKYHSRRGSIRLMISSFIDPESTTDDDFVEDDEFVDSNTD